MFQDFRYGLRSWKNHPGYTTAAILTLALGVAANTTMYSVAEGILFRPLPLKDLDRMVVIEGGHPGRFNELDISGADLMDLRENTPSFQYVTGASWWDANVTGEGFPEKAQGFLVTPDFFEMIGVQPALGRSFSTEDYNNASGTRVVILSEGLWERKFARDKQVVGRLIRLNGEAFMVVGIMPKSARVPAEAEIWSPLALGEKLRANPTTHFYTYARLKPEISMEQAGVELHALAPRFATIRPKSNAAVDLRVVLLRERISGNLTAEYTRMSLVAAAMLLLIAASNVANLLFAMISGRGREIAMRQALGSSRWRIVRQFLAESIVFGLASVPVALVLTLWAVDLNKRAMPAEIEIHLPGWQSIGIDGASLAFGIATALLTAVVAGLLPAWIGSRSDLNAQLREGGRSVAGTGSRSRVRAALVVVQVTFSMVLMAGGMLMYRGAKEMVAAAPGIHREEVQSASMTLPAKKYPKAERLAEFAQQVVEKARTLPGVESAALIHDVPYEGGWTMTHAETDRSPATLQGSRMQLPEVQMQLTSEGYFPLMGIPLRQGRDLSDSDGPDARPVAVISELAARQLFGEVDPVGQRIRLDNQPARWITVVGVCGDVLHTWILRHPQPTVYLPYRQTGSAGITVLMRAKSGKAVGLAPLWRQAMLQLDPELPLSHVDSLQRIVELQMVGLNHITGMLAVAGLMSLLLAVVGVYSLMSFAATERTREVGIRMAMGARSGEVIQMLVGQGLRLAGIGLGIGLLGAMGISQLFASLLYGVRAFDPVSLGLGAAVLALGAWLACYIPARWAARVDPMEALRHD